MQNMYEGCSIERIANLCNRYMITYDVMNFRYKLFETSSNPKNNRHHKSLVFVYVRITIYTQLKKKKIAKPYLRNSYHQ